MYLVSKAMVEKKKKKDVKNDAFVINSENTANA